MTFALATGPVELYDCMTVRSKLETKKTLDAVRLRVACRLMKGSPSSPVSYAYLRRALGAVCSGLHVWNEGLGC